MSNPFEQIEELQTPETPSSVFNVPTFKVDLEEPVNTIPVQPIIDNSTIVQPTPVAPVQINQEEPIDILDTPIPQEQVIPDTLNQVETTPEKKKSDYRKPFETPVNINVRPIYIYTSKTTPTELDEILDEFGNELLSEAESNKQYTKEPDKNGELRDKLYLTPNQQNKITTLSDNLVEAMYSIYHHNEHDGMIDRDNSEFVQTLKTTSGNYVRIAHPSFSIQDISKISDSDFSKAFNKITGSGDETVIPLFSSGIILLVKPITERALINLHEKLINKKEYLGRKTIGFSLSNDDVFLHKDVIEVILDHVVDCNLIKWNKTSLLKLISTADLDSLYAGFLETMYPSGYPINHVCKNVLKGSCDHTITSELDENGKLKPDTMLNFKKLVITDKSRLNQQMIDHMESLAKNHKPEVITSYQEMVSKLYPEKYRKNIVVFKSTNNNTNVSIKFKVPNLATFIDDSVNTINLLETMINSNITDKLDQEEKNSLHEKYSSQLSLFKILPWIDSVTLNSLSSDGLITGSKSSNTQKDILTVLESFNSNKEVNETITKTVQSFKDNVFISMTGVPNFICPKCKSPQHEEGSEIYSVIPFKILGFFLIQIASRFQDS